MSKTIKAGRAVTAIKGKASIDAAPVLPDGHSSKDYVGAASRLVAAYTETDNAVKTLEAQHATALAQTKGRAIKAIASVAVDFEGMTGAQFDEYLKPGIVQGLTAAKYASVPTRAAMIKVAFLAFAHGVEPSEENAHNLNNFVNKEARQALRDKGVIEADTRKKKAASPKQVDERMQAAIRLARTSADQSTDDVLARAELLVKCCTAGNWKLLEKKLAEMVKLVK